VDNLLDGLDERVTLEDANATYAPAWADERDGGLAAMQKLRFEQEAVRFGLAGDSTGNFTNEWFDLAAVNLGAAHPALRVENAHWNDTSQSWDAPVVVQAGTTVSSGVKARDTFTRTAADLSGSTPDLGPAWTNDGSNAVGDWTIDGSKAVATSETTRGAVFLDMQVDGEMETRIDFNISTVIAAGSRSVRFYTSYKDNANQIFGQAVVSQTTGAVTLNITKRIGNVATKISQTTDPTSAAIATNAADQNVTSRIKVVGTTVTFTLTKGGVTDTVTATLTESDLTALSGAKKGGISVNQSVPLPFTMDLVEVSLLTAAPLIEAEFWNSSVSGSTLDYQQSRIATLFPESLDVLFLSAGHNYGADSPEVHQGKIDAFIAAFHAVQPGVPIIITGQNPQFAPATQRVAHNKRQSMLRSYCRSRGFGYIPVTEKWLEQTGKGAALVQADGIHPTVGDTATGSSFWRDRVLDYLNAL
jgi:hypothetical protein